MIMSVLWPASQSKAFPTEAPCAILNNDNSGPESPLCQVVFEHISNTKAFNGILEQSAFRVKGLEDGDWPMQCMKTQPRTEALPTMGL